MDWTHVLAFMFGVLFGGAVLWGLLHVMNEWK